MVACLLGATAHAAARMVIERVEIPAAGVARLDLTILNASEEAVDHPSPETLPVNLTIDGRRYSLLARRDNNFPATFRIGPRGFVETRYLLELPQGLSSASGNAHVSLAESGVEIALRLTPGAPTQMSAAQPVETMASAEQASTIADKPADERNFGNFSAHEPIYIVYGPGASSSDGRLQISFKYQLFGSASEPANERSGIENIYIAYTQRMFADVNLPSNPFRAIDFQPELFYLFRPRPVGDIVDIGGRVGLRHISNGKGGLDSRSYNSLYVRPDFGLALGSQRLTVSPSAWFYFAKDSNNPDIARYRGYSGLSATLGSERGLMLAADSRYSFGSGKGAVDATLSYPLSNISSRLNLYLFGQVFTGYGESLFEYDRKTTRARIGIGLTR